jgi:hypothetical protein
VKCHSLAKIFSDLPNCEHAKQRPCYEPETQLGRTDLNGYAIECALKACIAKQGRRHEFPLKVEYVRRVYTHNLEELLKLADLEQQLQSDMRTNTVLARNWAIVKDWSEESRYAGSGLSGRDLHEAVAGPDGVLLWIKQRW